MIGPHQMLPFRASVNRGAMAMKRRFAFSKSSSITGTSPSDCLVSCPWHLLGGGVLLTCRIAVGAFYTSSRLDKLCKDVPAHYSDGWPPTNRKHVQRSVEILCARLRKAETIFLSESSCRAKPEETASKIRTPYGCQTISCGFCETTYF